MRNDIDGLRSVSPLTYVYYWDQGLVTPAYTKASESTANRSSSPV